MGLEVASYISELVATNPVSSDGLSQSDDHHRLLKTVLQTQFPNLGAAAVTPTATQLNYVTGVTSAIQTQLDSKITAAAYATGGYGRWVELQAPTDASSVASVNFTGLSSSYDVYLIELYSVLPSTNAATLNIRTDSDNGASYDAGASDYAYNISIGVNSSAATSIITTAALNNAANSGLGVSGQIFIVRPSLAQRCMIYGALTYGNSASAPSVVQFSGYRNAAADVDAVQFLFSSGDIASGRFRIHGRAKA